MLATLLVSDQTVVTLSVQHSTVVMLLVVCRS